jgi:type IV fimbrial biogenesis protein FimT
MDGRRRGFTLLELLLCLSIMSLATSWGFPYLIAAGRSSEASQFTHILTRALMSARSIAVASGKPVTLCASTDHHHCLKTWWGEVSLLIFTDRNRNYQLDGGDTLHLQQRLTLHHGTVYWRGSLGRPYLRYRGDGSAKEYGSYSYCPHRDGIHRDGIHAFRQLVVNRVGRVYLYHDGAGNITKCR